MSLAHSIPSSLLTLSLLVLSLGACGDATFVEPAHEGSTLTRLQSIGEEVVQGYPSYQERVILYMTNRARTEPDKFKPSEPYPATPPLQWDLALSKAARFHAAHINEADCWCPDHSSCCALEGAEMRRRAVGL